MESMLIITSSGTPCNDSKPFSKLYSEELEKQSTCNGLFEFCGQDLNCNFCFERDIRDRYQSKSESSWCNERALIHRSLQAAHVNGVLCIHTIFRVVYYLSQEPNQTYFLSLLQILSHRGRRAHGGRICGQATALALGNNTTGFHPQLASQGASPQSAWTVGITSHAKSRVD